MRSSSRRRFSTTGSIVRIGPLEDGTTTDASLRRVVDSLVDGVDGIRKGDHEWLELELVRSEAG